MGTLKVLPPEALTSPHSEDWRKILSVFFRGGESRHSEVCLCSLARSRCPLSGEKEQEKHLSQVLPIY